jgi:hypothetical protein
VCGLVPDTEGEGWIMKQCDVLASGLVVALSAVATGGCARAGRGEDLGSASSAFLNLNSLDPSALDATAQYPDALTPAMLSGAALDPGALSAPALAAIQGLGTSGWLSRQLLQYTVGCALDVTQSFSFTWVDEANEPHDVTDTGLLGLATGWAGAAVDTDGQQWVSACLASRVNEFGVAVPLSSRGGSAALTTTPEEVSAYPDEEGAFWGNLFAASPAVYACDDVADDDTSRSQDRVCAAGYVDGSGDLQSCGILQHLGSCDTYCEPLTGDAGQYHPGCAATPIDLAPSLTSQVITVFLQ